MRFKDELQRQIYYRGQIDFCYWVIQELAKNKCELQTPLEAMIDKATGFNIQRTIDSIDQIKHMVSSIIRCKKKLGYDPVKDKEFLKKLKDYEKQI